MTDAKNEMPECRDAFEAWAKHRTMQRTAETHWETWQAAWNARPNTAPRSGGDDLYVLMRQIIKDILGFEPDDDLENHLNYGCHSTLEHALKYLTQRGLLRTNPPADALPGVTVEDLCDDCPPIGYPTDKTRCLPCPRRNAIAASGDWVMVPREPTVEMNCAAVDEFRRTLSAPSIWNAMLAAAPAPELAREVNLREGVSGNKSIPATNGSYQVDDAATGAQEMPPGRTETDRGALEVALKAADALAEAAGELATDDMHDRIGIAYMAYISARAAVTGGESAPQPAASEGVY
ncbi:hypothetical protein [Rhodopila sp.]|uniref:hypothetical protein n=1 Tax=Rhodopila sp. TaxID=2480087 RepID=UPI003D0F059B